jgi:thioredoxin reductase (NADPH)
MARVIVVGDGPAGLSAALFLAKNGQEVVVYGQDDTPMHYAQLHNYLGVPEIDGTEFQRVARAQVVEQGATILEEQVDRVAHDGDAFVLDRAGGDRDRGDYLVVAGGKAAQRLVEQLGAERREGTVVVDSAYRTDVDDLYAVGRVARPNRSQAIISAGAGAVAALDILAREAGRDVTDWDTPPRND